MSFSLCIAFTYCTDDLVQGNEEGQEGDMNSKKTTRRPSVRSRRSTVHAKKESILFETFQHAAAIAGAGGGCKTIDEDADDKDDQKQKKVSDENPIKTDESCSCQGGVPLNDSTAL